MTEAAVADAEESAGVIPGPHGGVLKELVASDQDAERLREEATHLPSWTLTQRQLSDVELLINGGFSPLEGFLTRPDYEQVLSDMRLLDGTLWPMPITLDVPDSFVSEHQVRDGSRIVLRHPEGVPVGILDVAGLWRPDRQVEADAVFGTRSVQHPGVAFLFEETNPVYLGGRIDAIRQVPHHTYREDRHTPRELRDMFAERGWDRVVAFQTRNPLHRAHVELIKRAAADEDAAILLHPVVGRTRPGDVDYFSRVRCYRAVLPRLDGGRTALSLLPLAMRMGGPREALWHAIIRKNHGASHFIVGRDHAGPGKDADGKDFYGPYDAQELVREHEDELGIRLVPFREMVYVQDEDAYLPADEVPEGEQVLRLSGTELRQALRLGTEIPSWFSYPEVIEELRRTYPPRHQQGFTVFFTGLSGAGKSTIANILVAKLNEAGGRPVTLLDGDIVRTHLSSELGFSKEHRDLNIRRIGFVASEITKNRGIAVCAPIAPYQSTRRAVRKMIEAYGGFVLVHVATPLEVCEERDPKGLYAKARAGLIENFTGISDPFEEPKSSEVVVDTTDLAPEEAAMRVYDYLVGEGFLEDGHGRGNKDMSERF